MLGCLPTCSDQAVGKLSQVRVLEGAVNLVQGPAQTIALFHQMHRKSLIGERQGRGHAAQAARR